MTCGVVSGGGGASADGLDSPLGGNHRRSRHVETEPRHGRASVNDCASDRGYLEHRDWCDGALYPRHECHQFTNGARWIRECTLFFSKRPLLKVH